MLGELQTFSGLSSEEAVLLWFYRKEQGLALASIDGIVILSFSNFYSNNSIRH